MCICAHAEHSEGAGFGAVTAQTSQTLKTSTQTGLKLFPIFAVKFLLFRFSTSASKFSVHPY